MSIVTHETDPDADVFEDLQLPDAANLRIRSLLMIEIGRLLDEQGLTQARAAELMGTTQPCISDVVNGRLERFTIDRLVTMLAAAGRSVTLTVERAA